MPAATIDPAEILTELERRLVERPQAKAADFSRPRLPRVHCADGFNVSVQAHDGAYCTPRDDVGPWWKVELGFASAPMPELAEYCDSFDTNATETVWGYVPLKRVAEVIAAHGGLLQAERYPDECEGCGRGDAADRRSPYDPTPGPLLLCDTCADDEAQAQAERAAEGR